MCALHKNVCDSLACFGLACIRRKLEDLGGVERVYEFDAHGINGRRERGLGSSRRADHGIPADTEGFGWGCRQVYDSAR
jgi:hypothetical protein